jgi:hypothetical protein
VLLLAGEQRLDFLGLEVVSLHADRDQNFGEILRHECAAQNNSNECQEGLFGT